MPIRRAKIVCTIGPASDDPAVLRDLVAAGMNVARLNFSHGSHKEHEARIVKIRQVAAECGQPVAILQDLCGPKIRCGIFQGGAFEVTAGQQVRLVEASKGPAGADEVPIDYEGLAADLRTGDALLLDDGRVGLTVTGIKGGLVQAEVTQGGRLRDKAGVHIPAERVRLATFTEKDRHDLAFGLAQEVDYVALSFVRSASDVQLVKEICDAWGRSTPIVAKIETPQAVDHLEGIVLASDAVMVARGDLGVELSPEQVPVVQREVLGLARRHGRAAVVATEMMQSMTTSVRPTRAEASDVATAVFDGADAVMLSGETAMGDHPALVVRTMHRIVVEAERSRFYNPEGSRASRHMSVAQAVARGASDIAKTLGARAIVAFTEGGQTARFAAEGRPTVPIIGLSPNAQTLRRLALIWGLVPIPIEAFADSDTMIARAQALLLDNGIVSSGDRFVTLFGAPVGVSGATNALQVRVVE